MSTNMFHVIALDWSQVTYIPTSTKMGEANKGKSDMSTVPLPENCVMTPAFWDDP